MNSGLNGKINFAILHVQDPKSPTKVLNPKSHTLSPQPFILNPSVLNPALDPEP